MWNKCYVISFGRYDGFFLFLLVVLSALNALKELIFFDPSTGSFNIFKSSSGLDKC